MEEDIANWKNSWKEEKSDASNVQTLIVALNKLEKKEKRERVFIGVAFPLTLLFLGLVLPIFESYYYSAAIFCIGIGMITLLIQIYWSKLKYKDEGSFTNQEYIKKNIKRLKGKMMTTSRYMWGYTFLLLTGLNIGYLEVLRNVGLPLRITIHGVLSIAILVFMYFGIQRRSKKNTKEIVPLINRLESLMD